jgi:hypothetical protein
MEQKTFACEICLKEKTLAQGEKTPVCCGVPMVPRLPGCGKPFVAETARPDDADEPCDDGTDGNK